MCSDAFPNCYLKGTARKQHSIRVLFCKGIPFAKSNCNCPSVAAPIPYHPLYAHVSQPQVNQLIGEQSSAAGVGPSQEAADQRAAQLERILLDVFSQAPHPPAVPSPQNNMAPIIAMAVAKHTKPSAYRLLKLMEDCERAVAGVPR